MSATATHLILHPLLKVTLLVSGGGEIVVHALHLLCELCATLLLQALQERLLLLLYLACVQQAACQLLAVELSARPGSLNTTKHRQTQH